MTSYQVIAQRSEKYWHLEVEGLPQGTQARNLAEAEAMAKELISIFTGQAIESIQVILEVKVPERIREAQEAAVRYRAEAEQASSMAAAKSREAARLMKEQGMTLKDIGQTLHVSYQRAGQLVSG
ncbi:hypothetical protein NBM05_03715 [Rothia sp. AR01]|uniref:Uncharacterized protein n=1 Tax=Rothia santali TaxID=2949643 RepID=A0A9X2KKK9_9MICC|nr:hypothetical protein [Rothia santali]MCP3425156.1 hypothetical protein [Rothia santali]